MSSDKTPDSTHFGFEQVAHADKAGRVRGVFDSVADKYDVMNDLMSFGIHRAWKRFTISQARVRPGHQVLDLASGTGDLAGAMLPKVGKRGLVVSSDINAAMLHNGRDRLLDQGLVGNLYFAQADAEALPFTDESFDCITMAFGLRNVTDKARALASMYRVLKPGGKVLVLEFSHPTAPALKPIYDLYSFKVLPKIGELVAGDSESYRYLAESIRMHPDQDTLLGMFEDAGFERCTYHNLTGGIVALHRGYRI